MKLYYFDVAGRAEATRIMFDLGDVQYEDVRFGREEWANEFKAKSPTGQAPFLELDDGTIICQSTATAVYAAELAGLWPSEPVQRAKTLELMACLEDVLTAVGPTMALPDLAERTAARAELMRPGGKVHSCFAVLDALLARSSTPYYLGSNIGLADVALFVATCTLAGGMMDGAQFGAAAVYRFQHVKRLRDAVANHPKMVARYRAAEGLGAAFKPDGSS